MSDKPNFADDLNDLIKLNDLLHIGGTLGKRNLPDQDIFKGLEEYIISRDKNGAILRIPEAVKFDPAKFMAVFSRVKIKQEFKIKLVSPVPGYAKTMQVKVPTAYLITIIF